MLDVLRRRSVMRVYTEHIAKLSEDISCKVVQRPNLPGMMYVEFGYVEAPTIYCQSDYLVNLHELGHFAWGHTQGRPPKRDERFYFDNGVLKSEAQAWEWALDRCSDDLLPESRNFMWNTCLGSYYNKALSLQGATTRLLNGNRGFISFVFDEPDEYFFSIVKRIRGH